MRFAGSNRVDDRNQLGSFALPSSTFDLGFGLIRFRLFLVFGGWRLEAGDFAARKFEVRGRMVMISCCEFGKEVPGEQHKNNLKPSQKGGQHTAQ